MKKLLTSIMACILAFSVVFVAGCKNKEQTEETIQVNKDVVVSTGYDYKIVYDADADVIIKNAAVELQDYVKQVSGINLSIEFDDDVKIKDKTRVISLGKTKFFDYHRDKVDFDALGPQGFVVKTVDAGNVYIDANTSKGVLFGVYDFLEKNFGVKFIAPDVTHVPTNDGLVIHELNIEEIPAFEMRAYYSRYIQTNPQFAAHMRMQFEHTYEDERFGLFEMNTEAHRILEYVPASYYDTHPEWFWYYGNKVKDICYSHTGLLENGEIDKTLDVSPVTLAAEHLYEKVTDPANAHISYFQISQSDTYSTECCDCAGCMEQTSKYGRSGMVVRFVNAVSEVTKQKLAKNGISRDFNIVTFAYRWSELPPWDYANNKVLHKSVIPADNVYVRIAPIFTRNYYTMLDELQRDSVQKIFTYWQKVTDNLMIWTYDTDFQGYMTYYPVYRTFGDNFKLYKEMNVTYVMLQGAHNEPMLWQELMNTYICSKMLWNPELNVEELKNEFLTYYFEDASEYVKQFIDNMDMQYATFMDASYPEDQRPNTWCYSIDLQSSKYYTATFWERQLSVLEQGVEAVSKMDISEETKNTLLKRVNMVKLTPQYMFALKYSEYYPEDQTGRYYFLKEFFDNCAAVGINVCAESMNIEQLKYSLGYTAIH